MNKYVKILLIIVIFNIIFFSPLFFPKTKLIITPEFFGGDNVLVYYPYQKASCDSLLKGEIPFWSKDIGQGYPLLGEGEVGAFNPINITSCLLAKGDYKLAFNINILLNNILGQFGMVLLAEALGLTLISGLFLGIVFALAPILLMNYMQILLVYPLLYMGYIMTFLIKFFDKNTFKNFILMTLFISLQLLVCHYQMFFVSYVFISVFVVYYLYFDKTTKKKKFFIFFIFNFSYLLGVLLAAPQVFPAIEFVLNSNRSANSESMAVIFDQNMTLKSLVTLINPYLLGSPVNGTYDFSGIHPWESNFSIHTLPFIFFLYVFYKTKKIFKNKYFKAILFATIVVLFISFGKNSPIYLIHSLPIFSSFRFPSRFTAVVVLGLTILVTFGFDFFLKKFKPKKLIIVLIFTIIIAEAGVFFYNFHVLKYATNVNVDSIFVQVLKNDSFPIYTTSASSGFLDKKYIKDGYSQKPDWYYEQINNLLNGNNNAMYDISSFSNKSGPQLKRKTLLQRYLSDIYVLEKHQVETDKYFYPILKLSGVKYLLSIVPFKNTSEVELISEKKSGEYNIYLYKINGHLDKVNFYSQHKEINTQYDFENLLLNTDFRDTVLLEEYHLQNNLIGEDPIYKYQIVKDLDQYLKIETQTNHDSILYLPRNWYPSWKAYVNGKETKIHKANISYMAIDLPKGNNIVEFKFESKIFIWGLIVSLATFSILAVYRFWRGMRSTSLRS